MIPAGALYGIADVDALSGGAPSRGDPARVAAAAAAMARGGASWVQLRAKRLADDDLLRCARACRDALPAGTAALWIDDRPDVAAMVGADGVQVGQDDLPPWAVRRVVGEACRIGRSTHDRDQVLEAAADPEVDVVAVGPVYATTGKASPDPVVGLDLVRWARARTEKTLVAIGGIDAERLRQVLAAGADSAAVLGALCRPAGGDGAEESIERAARHLLHGTRVRASTVTGEERSA
jgi:thiamine-phosphate pyrophosphorylase